MRATFFGALISAERAWFASIGQGRGWLLRGDEARELGAESAPADSAPAETNEATDTPDVAETVLGQEGAEAHVASVFLIPGDAIVLAGQGASAALSGAEILSTACVACDAKVAAANIADVAAKSHPEESITLALWSADSAMYKPVPVVIPEPEPVAAAATASVSAAAPAAASWPDVAPAAAVAGGAKGEKIFLMAMSAWIIVAFLALGGAAIYSVTSASTRASAGAASSPAAESAAVEPTTPPSTEPVVPSEFPKQLVAPKNVKGGLWLRRSATTVGGGNEVVILKGGAKITAVDSAMGTDDKGQPQEFYILNVSDISASQVIKNKLHPWPPAKSIKKVYVFAGSF
jgi:hypothetical protein